MALVKTAQRRADASFPRTRCWKLGEQETELKSEASVTESTARTVEIATVGLAVEDGREGSEQAGRVMSRLPTRQRR